MARTTFSHPPEKKKTDNFPDWWEQNRDELCLKASMGADLQELLEQAWTDGRDGAFEDGEKKGKESISQALEDTKKFLEEKIKEVK